MEKLLKAGNGDAALLYLCITAGQNSGALPWGPDRVEAAQNTLLRLGLISSDTPVQPPRPEKLEDDRPPDYTTQDIAQAFQNDGGFKALVPAVEQMLGKVLSPPTSRFSTPSLTFWPCPRRSSSPSPAGAWSRPSRRGPAASPPSPRSAGRPTNGRRPALTPWRPPTPICTG